MNWNLSGLLKLRQQKNHSKEKEMASYVSIALSSTFFLPFFDSHVTTPQFPFHERGQLWLQLNVTLLLTVSAGLIGRLPLDGLSDQRGGKWWQSESYVSFR